MSLWIIILIIVIFLIIKIICDIMAFSPGENISRLLKLILFIFLLGFLLMLSFMVFLVNFIQKELNSTDINTNITETTEIHDYSEHERVFDPTKVAESSNYKKEENQEKKKKVIKTKVVKTCSRSNSGDRNTVSGKVINNLASLVFKNEKMKNEEKMVESEKKNKNVCYGNA